MSQPLGTLRSNYLLITALAGLYPYFELLSSCGQAVADHLSISRIKRAEYVNRLFEKKGA